MARWDNIDKCEPNIGVLKSKEEIMFYSLLNEINKRTEPIGSWTLYERLNSMGIKCGTATVGRYLKMLDGKGYSVCKSNQGRVITHEGSVYLKSMSQNLARAEIHDDASEGLRVNDFADLIDLIHARKTLEVAMIQEAVDNATPEEVNALRKSVSSYYRLVSENKNHDAPAYNFHTILAEMSHNKYYKTLLDLLFFEEQQIEERMDKLATRERGGVYVIQHDDIASAVEASNVELAQSLMAKHFDLMLSDVKRQIDQIEEMKSLVDESLI